jgi:hypothetical protein
MLNTREVSAVHHEGLFHADHDDPDRPGHGLAVTEQAAPGRFQGHHDHIVLIRPHHALTFAPQHADDRKRHVVEPDGLPQHVCFTKQLFGHRDTHQHHPGAAAHLSRLEGPAFRQGPAPGQQIIVVDALYRGRPVHVARDHLHAAAHGGGGSYHPRHLPANRPGVVLRQPGAGAGAETRPTIPVGAGHDHEHVGPQGCNLGVHLPLRAGAHRHHGDDRRHPDDDAEHGEQAAQHIGLQRGNGNEYRFGQVHALFLKNRVCSIGTSD